VLPRERVHDALLFCDDRRAKSVAENNLGRAISEFEEILDFAFIDVFWIRNNGSDESSLEVCSLLSCGPTANNRMRSALTASL
jgi:hypothetical protein